MITNCGVMRCGACIIGRMGLRGVQIDHMRCGRAAMMLVCKQRSSRLLTCSVWNCAIPFDHEVVEGELVSVSRMTAPIAAGVAVTAALRNDPQCRYVGKGMGYCGGHGQVGKVQLLRGLAEI